MTKAKRENLKSIIFKVPEDTVPVPSSKAQARPDRAGKKQTIFHMPEAAKKQLAMLAIETDTTQQALLSEALNDLFKKHGKLPIA